MSRPGATLRLPSGDDEARGFRLDHASLTEDIMPRVRAGAAR